MLVPFGLGSRLAFAPSICDDLGGTDAPGFRCPPAPSSVVIDHPLPEPPERNGSYAPSADHANKVALPSLLRPACSVDEDPDRGISGLDSRVVHTQHIRLGERAVGKAESSRFSTGSDTASSSRRNVAPDTDISRDQLAQLTFPEASTGMSTVGICPASKRIISPSQGQVDHMGLLWRMFAPKPLKKARRTVRKATHPVHTATRAVTPRSVKQLQCAAHPVSLAELKIEDAAVNALRGKPRKKPSRRPAQASKKTPAASKRNQSRQDPVDAAIGPERPAQVRDGIQAVLLGGNEDLKVVGESHYQENLWRLVSPRRRGDQVRCAVQASLVAEDDNPYDANAVAVWVQGLKVGHLSRDDARRYRPGLLSLQDRHGQPIALLGVITSLCRRSDSACRKGSRRRSISWRSPPAPAATPRAKDHEVWLSLDQDASQLAWRGRIPLLHRVYAEPTVNGQPPMADIGRVGWRKPGSLMPWPGSLAATARHQISARSSSLAPARSGVRRSLSSRANRQFRI